MNNNEIRFSKQEKYKEDLFYQRQRQERLFKEEVNRIKRQNDPNFNKMSDVQVIGIISIALTLGAYIINLI